MNDGLSAPENRLIGVLAETARGPKRNGAFAIWLFVRACDGLLPPDRLREHTNRRRLQGLEPRLSSLMLPPPLKRALASGLRELGDTSARGAALALQRLVAPAKETVSGEAGAAVAAAARKAREAAQKERSA